MAIGDLLSEGRFQRRLEALLVPINHVLSTVSDHEHLKLVIDVFSILTLRIVMVRRNQVSEQFLHPISRLFFLEELLVTLKFVYLF